MRVVIRLVIPAVGELGGFDWCQLSRGGHRLANLCQPVMHGLSQLSGEPPHKDTAMGEGMVAQMGVLPGEVLHLPISRNGVQVLAVSAELDLGDHL